MAKDTCEAARRISIFWLKKHEYLNGIRGGTLSWNRNGTPSGSISIAVDLVSPQPYARLVYTSTNRWSGEKNEMDYKVPIATAKCHFGGVRYWFICPLVKNGIPCTRRVGVLYDIDKWYGCRHCANLAYQSQQETHTGRWGYIGKAFNLERKVNEAMAGIRVKYWRGRPTKRFARILKMKQHLCSVDYLEMERALMRML